MSYDDDDDCMPFGHSSSYTWGSRAWRQATLNEKVLADFAASGEPNPFFNAVVCGLVGGYFFGALGGVIGGIGGLVVGLSYGDNPPPEMPKPPPELPKVSKEERSGCLGLVAGTAKVIGGLLIGGVILHSCSGGESGPVRGASSSEPTSSNQRTANRSSAASAAGVPVVEKGRSTIVPLSIVRTAFVRDAGLGMALRSAPNPSGAEVGTVQCGDKVSLLEEVTGAWTRVAMPGKKYAYLDSSVLSYMSVQCAQGGLRQTPAPYFVAGAAPEKAGAAGVVFVTAAKGVNVRASADSAGVKVDSLKCGEKISVPDGITAEWTKIVYPDSTYAFASSNFLSYARPQCAL